jgi:hypothetical protein
MNESKRDLHSILKERYKNFPKSELLIVSKFPEEKRSTINELMTKGTFIEEQMILAYQQDDKEMLEFLFYENIQLGKDLDDAMGI